MRLLTLYHKIEWVHFRTHEQNILVMGFNINYLNFFCLIKKMRSHDPNFLPYCSLFETKNKPYAARFLPIKMFYLLCLI